MLFKKSRKLQIDFFTTLKGVVSLLRDPGQTDSVYDIEDGLKKTQAMQVALEYIKKQPGVSEIVRERYLAPPPNLEQLLQLPQNSLGYIYASALTEAGFDPNFYRKVQVTDDISYVFLRIRQTHDIWHCVTGFDVDVNGELGLKAFELAQTRRTMSAVLIAGGLMRTLFNTPENLDGLLNNLAIGYRMGARAKPFLSQKWEEHWEKPVEEWRKELGVELTQMYIP
jgi:ubiquinone biosynthesis protein COQ4